MKATIGLILISALWLGTLYLWHWDHSELKQAEQTHQKFESDQNDQISNMRAANDAESNLAAAFQKAYAELEEKNERTAKLTSEISSNFYDYRISSEANQALLQKENESLRSSLIKPASQPIVVQQPYRPAWDIPISTTTTGTVIHPDGSMSEIFLDTQ